LTTQESVYELLLKVKGRRLNLEKVSLEATFKTDLEFDSLDWVTMAELIESKFNISFELEDVRTLKTVGQAIRLVDEKLAALQQSDH
jgi:acyl carrier protein